MWEQSAPAGTTCIEFLHWLAANVTLCCVSWNNFNWSISCRICQLTCTWLATCQGHFMLKTLKHYEENTFYHLRCNILVTCILTLARLSTLQLRMPLSSDIWNVQMMGKPDAACLLVEQLSKYHGSTGSVIVWFWASHHWWIHINLVRSTW